VLIGRRMAVLAVHFGDDQLGAVGVVEAAEVGLRLKS
jgi:hypothetical protein